MTLRISNSLVRDDGNKIVDPYDVLQAAAERNTFEDVIVVGLKADGETYYAASTADKSRIINLLTEFIDKLNE